MTKLKGMKMTMSCFLSTMLLSVCLFTETMDNSITMPSRQVLEKMLQDTSLHDYAKQEELDALYNLAEKNVEGEFLLNVVESFYSNFRLLQLTNNIPKNLICQNIGVCVSMEYAYLAKNLFEKNLDYWITIENVFADEVRLQGFKDFNWLNIKEEFYQLKY